MSPLRRPVGQLVGVALAALLQACGPHQCPGPVLNGSQLTGTVDYTAGDGTRSSSAVMSGEIVSGDGSGALGLSGTFTDGIGASRPFTLQLSGLSAGTMSSLASGSQACLSLATGAPPACAPLVGTFDVQELSSTCIGSQGCSVNIQGTFAASADVEGTRLVVDGTLDNTTTTVEEMCGQDP